MNLYQEVVKTVYMSAGEGVRDTPRFGDVFSSEASFEDILSVTRVNADDPNTSAIASRIFSPIIIPLTFTFGFQYNENKLST